MKREIRESLEGRHTGKECGGVRKMTREREREMRIVLWSTHTVGFWRGVEDDEGSGRGK